MRCDLSPKFFDHLLLKGALPILIRKAARPQLRYGLQHCSEYIGRGVARNFLCMESTATTHFHSRLNHETAASACSLEDFKVRNGATERHNKVRGEADGEGMYPHFPWMHPCSGAGSTFLRLSSGTKSDKQRMKLFPDGVAVSSVHSTSYVAVSR